MKPSSFIVLFITLGITFFGCTTEIKFEDLVGTYVAEYPYGKETLILKNDSSYTQSFSSFDGKSATNSDRWQLRDNEIDLHNPLIIDSGFGELNHGFDKRMEGIAIHRVTSFLGRISLVISEDVDLAYKKQSE